MRAYAISWSFPTVCNWCGRLPEEDLQCGGARREYIWRVFYYYYYLFQHECILINRFRKKKKEHYDKLFENLTVCAYVLNTTHNGGYWKKNIYLHNTRVAQLILSLTNWVGFRTFYYVLIGFWLRGQMRINRWSVIYNIMLCFYIYIYIY